MSRYEKKTIITYIAASLIIFGASFISLIWNYWSVPVSYASGMIIGLVNLILLMKQSESLAENDSPMNLSRGSVGLRQLLLLIGVVVPAIIIYCIYPKYGDRLFYLGLLATGVPYMLVTAVIGVIKPTEADLNEIQKKYEEKHPLSENAVKPGETEKETSGEKDADPYAYFDRLNDYGFSKTSWEILTDDQKAKVLSEIARGRIKLVRDGKKEDKQE